MTARSRPFKVGLIQMKCAVDPVRNLERALTLLADAAALGAHVACLPELFLTPYFCQSFDASKFNLAEPIPGPTTRALAETARSTSMAIVGSIFEHRAPGLYHNTAVVLDADGALVGSYRKMHIPDDPLYYEKYYFTPGDLGFKTFATRHARIGTLVCWDQWYPEAARLTALRGAEILFYPTAIGWHPSEKSEFGAAQADAWETMQRAHAIANGVYVAAVNRVGLEGAVPPGPGVAASQGLEFWGGSFLADPFGRVLARAGRHHEEVLVVECDPALQEETRRNWPFFRDRRIDAYDAITERYLDPS